LRTHVREQYAGGLGKVCGVFGFWRGGRLSEATDWPLGSRRAAVVAGSGAGGEGELATGIAAEIGAEIGAEFGAVSAEEAGALELSQPQRTAIEMLTSGHTAIDSAM